MQTADKLTTDERRRLEALNQAIQCSPFQGEPSTPETILQRAKLFDGWIKDGTVATEAKLKVVGSNQH